MKRNLELSTMASERVKQKGPKMLNHEAKKRG